MGFLSDNQHFIRIKLGSEMKGLSSLNKELKYVTELQLETRERLKKSFSYCLGNLDKKLAFYDEVLEILGAYEADYILLSIYFDTSTDEIINFIIRKGHNFQFSNKALIKSLFLSFNTDSSKDNESRTQGFLRNFFSKCFGLKNDILNLDDMISPDRVVNYIFNSINDKQKEQELVEFFVHFNKFWSIYYDKPYNTKSILLTYKIDQYYQQLNPTNPKFNLLGSLKSADNVTKALLPPSPCSPFNQLVDISLNPNIYNAASENKLQNKLTSTLLNINNYLEADNIFFTDLSAYSIEDLFIGFTQCSFRGHKAYIREFERRKDLNILPSIFNLIQFSSIKQRCAFEESPEAQDLYFNILKTNYLFF
jgi:hypothetical protein